MADESIEVRVARLEERDISQWKTLDSIAKGIDRIEKKLDQPLPCDTNELRLDNLEKLVGEDHGPRIDTVESRWDKWSGRMLILGPILLIIATAFVSWISSILSATRA